MFVYKKLLALAALMAVSVSVLIAQEALGIDGNGNVTVSETLTVSKTITSVGAIDTQGKIKEKGNDLIPRGSIIMWSGDINAIPAGWSLCDGTDNTPDLRSRFIVGASRYDARPAGRDPYDRGNTGGEERHQLTTREMPRHNHDFEDFYWSEDRGWTDHPAASCKTPTTLMPVDQTGGHAPDVDFNNGPYLFFNHPTDDYGDNGTHENRPPYYALAFIMKTE